MLCIWFVLFVRVCVVAGVMGCGCVVICVMWDDLFLDWRLVCAFVHFLDMCCLSVCTCVCMSGGGAACAENTYEADATNPITLTGGGTQQQGDNSCTDQPSNGYCPGTSGVSDCTCNLGYTGDGETTCTGEGPAYVCVCLYLCVCVCAIRIADMCVGRSVGEHGFL